MVVFSMFRLILSSCSLMPGSTAGTQRRSIVGRRALGIALYMSAGDGWNNLLVAKHGDRCFFLVFFVNANITPFKGDVEDFLRMVRMLT